MLTASIFLLWVAVILLTVAVVALTRQMRLVHERIGPSAVRMAGAGVTPGEAAPVISAPTLAGDMLTIGGASQDGRALLLIFVRPDCATCSDIVGDALTLCDASRLRLLTLGDGTAEDYADLARRHRLRDADMVLNAQVGADFRIGPLPSAALIDVRGRLLACSVVEKRGQLEALLAHAQLQPAAQHMEYQL